jgi:predicted lipid-binding transport protein (Tim44 family)
MAGQKAGLLCGFAASAGFSLLAAMIGTVAHAQTKSLDISPSAPLVPEQGSGDEGSMGDSYDNSTAPDDQGSAATMPQNVEPDDSSPDNDTQPGTAPQPPADEWQFLVPQPPADQPQPPAPYSSPGGTPQ